MIAYILRGITGSGKTSFARVITARHIGKTAVHSTDDRFTEDGIYRFDARKLEEHHKKNLAAFRKSLEESVPIVICDNTNSRIWEYEPYVRASKEFGYALKIIVFPPPSIEIALARSTHDVPRAVIERMVRRFEYDARAVHYDNGDL
jgi:predicted kinase